MKHINDRNRYPQTANLILTAMFTALTAVGAYLSLPLPFTPVPVTLATLASMMAGIFLGPKYGSLSQIIYLFIGIAGIPVFHNFTAGVGIITGPTGGYLLGYIAIAFCGGLACRSTNIRDSKSESTGAVGSKRKNLRMIMMLTVGNLICYGLGTLWFTFSTGASASAAIASCVLPFIPGDIFKIAAAVFFSQKLRRLRSYRV